MKKELIFAFLTCVYTSTFSQNKKLTSISNDSILYIKEQINDSTIVVKETIKKEGVIKSTRFNLIDSIWVESSNQVLINGKLVKQAERNRDGTGIIKEYGGNETIVSTTEIKNNLKHGEYFSFYLNGSLKEKGRFQDDLKVGEWLYFSEDAKTIVIENYIVKRMTHDDLARYSKEEINSWSWNSKNFVSLKHGSFKTLNNGKIIQTSTFENQKKIK